MIATRAPIPRMKPPAPRSAAAQRLMDECQLEADRTRLAWIARIVSGPNGAQHVWAFERVEKMIAAAEAEASALARARRLAAQA